LTCAMSELSSEETAANQGPTAIYRVDPLLDPRWKRFSETHPLAAVFHSVPWLEALRRTYGYKPVVLTTSAPNDVLANGLVFCRISSWITGRRFVSLPFSDHCDVLASSPAEQDCLLLALGALLREEDAKYAEIRPLHSTPAGQTGFHPGQDFLLHTIDLRRPAEDLFHSFHKDSIQRKIRRSEREGVTVEQGRSEAVLDKFYGLFLMTRRRHQLPPPPRIWFRNLIATLGDHLRIAVAAKAGRPIAAIVTLRFRDTVVYKYGASDPRFHALGGMHALFWRAIQDAQLAGLSFMDLGRSDVSDEGLVTFKDRWGSSRSRVQYFRNSLHGDSATGTTRGGQAARKVFSVMPLRLLGVAGRLLYKHVG